MTPEELKEVKENLIIARSALGVLKGENKSPMTRIEDAIAELSTSSRNIVIEEIIGLILERMGKIVEHRKKCEAWKSQSFERIGRCKECLVHSVGMLEKLIEHLKNRRIIMEEDEEECCERSHRGER